MADIEVFFTRPNHPAGDEVVERIIQDIRKARKRVLVATFSATDESIFEAIMRNWKEDKKLYEGWQGDVEAFIKKYGVPVRGSRIKDPYREHGKYHYSVLMESDLIGDVEGDVVARFHITKQENLDKRGYAYFVPTGVEEVVFMGIKQKDGSWVRYRKGPDWPEDVSIDWREPVMQGAFAHRFHENPWSGHLVEPKPRLESARVLLDSAALKATRGFEHSRERTLRLVTEFITENWREQALDAESLLMDLMVGKDLDNWEKCTVPQKQYDEKDLPPARVGLRVLGSDDEEPFSGTMHHKFLIVDDILWTGSFNLTLSARHHNYENMLRIADPGVAGQFAQEFEILWEMSKTPGEIGGEFAFRCWRCWKDVRSPLFFVHSLEGEQFGTVERSANPGNALVMCEQCVELLDEYGVALLWKYTKKKNLKSRWHSIPAYGYDDYLSLFLGMTNTL